MRPSPLVLGLALAFGCTRSFAPTSAGDAAPAGVSARPPALVEPPPASGPVAPPSPAGEADSQEAQALRERLVRKVSGAISDEKVLAVLRAVPRHLFVPGASLDVAYADAPAPIGYGQTISQPTVVAMMTAALELTGTERVLEIGTGSGYQAAVLARLAKEVYTIEIVEPLGLSARERLARMGYTNVKVRIGDGYQGWPEAAPFDRVIVTAAPETVPKALVAQLADGGVLVAPVGPEGETQQLLRLRKWAGKTKEEHLAPVRFVPMVPGR
jgi:protein-L-isoaspartate(D-aspartate) O-methyltransferase